jgi:hypothetical protein
MRPADGAGPALTNPSFFQAKPNFAKPGQIPAKTIQGIRLLFLGFSLRF